MPASPAPTPVYLDYQATTPVAPETLDAMAAWAGEPGSQAGWANPHSAHPPGRRAAAAIELARMQVLGLLPEGGKLIFTSGATEALNLGLRGSMPALSPRRKIVTVATEHAAVRDTCLWLERQGHPLVLLPVQANGLIDLDAARSAIDETTALVAVMLVNNEIGVIQPVAQLADIAHQAGALLLCDAVQGYGRIAIPGGVDLVAMSAHKIHGPKGVGALWVRSGIALEPLLHGGGQEGGVRAGTLSPALCAGFGAAARLAQDRMVDDMAHVDALWHAAQKLFDGWTINGSVDARYRGNLNIRKPGLDVSRLMSEVRGVAFSAGSACASGSGRPSHVLAALGLATAEIRSSVRLGFGRYTSVDDLARAAHLINQAAREQGC